MKAPWEALNRSTRFKLALAVARRRGPAFVRAFDNVVSVGAGYRLRGTGENLQDEICLCFFVRRKWTDVRARAQKIPAFVAAYPTLRGKRVRVLVPTDVSELRGGTPQSVLNLTSGVTSQAAGAPMDFGSVCCRVRNVAIPRERYLLACYHVFSSSLKRPPQRGVACVADDQTPLGPVSEAADPTGASAIDAALVGLDDASIQDISLWGLAPNRRATDFDIGELPDRGQLFVLGRRVAPPANGLPAQVRSEPLPAFFRAVLPGPTEFDYRTTARRTFFFADTIQYRSAVRPGDSGSAVVDVTGMLYGMHFFGQGAFGFALSAPRLFDPGVFSLDISL